MKAQLTRQMLEDYGDQYKKIGAESVIRNNHMNNISTDEQIPQKKIEKVISTFVQKITSIQDEELEKWKSKIDLLESVTDYATDFKEKRKRDAILVDFINYIGIKQGVDYALYTSDLSRERNKEKQ